MPNKSSLRTELLKKRRSLTPEARHIAAEKALHILKNTSLILPNSIVAAYWPMKDEFDVRPIIDWLHAENIICALPCFVALKSALIFRRYAKDDALIKEPLFNIPRPAEDAPLLTPTVILTPGVGFDRKGYRIGMGGGFYDRTLAAHNALTIGIFFAASEVEKVPHEPHDIRLHAILSEKELIKIDL